MRAGCTVEQPSARTGPRCEAEVGTHARRSRACDSSNQPLTGTFPLAGFAEAYDGPSSKPQIFEMHKKICKSSWNGGGKPPEKCVSLKVARSEPQHPRRLHLRQRAHLGEHVRRHVAVDLDQRDGVAAGRFAADMEGRDVDAGVAHASTRTCR